MSMNHAKMVDEALQLAAQKIREKALNLKRIPILRWTQEELCNSCGNEECPRKGYIAFCEWRPRKEASI